jgi:hypothetical protein
MRIHNLYEDEAGVSHFRDVEVEWDEFRPANKFSARQPASGIVFRETTKDYTVDRHPAPRRQYVINLDAAVHITAGDGETRYIGPGEVVLVEDTAGKGHISKFVGGAMRRSIFVALD